MGNSKNGANLGFENRLWEMADKMCDHMDAAEYKHVVLGRFAAAEGKAGGEFYTPQCVVRLLVSMIALPGQLFYTTQIPVCLWFLTRSKKADTKRGYRDRKGQTLFIDARRMGTLVDRVHRELTEDDLKEIADIYHQWRGEGGDYEDKAGWWKSASLDEIKGHGYVLTPGRYVGAEEIEDNGVPFEEKMKELSAELYGQFAKADRLEAAIRKNLELLGFGE